MLKQRANYDIETSYFPLKPTKKDFRIEKRKVTQDPTSTVKKSLQTLKVRSQVVEKYTSPHKSNSRSVSHTNLNESPSLVSNSHTLKLKAGLHLPIIEAKKQEVATLTRNPITLSQPNLNMLGVGTTLSPSLSLKIVTHAAKDSPIQNTNKFTSEYSKISKSLALDPKQLQQMNGNQAGNGLLSPANLLSSKVDKLNMYNGKINVRTGPVISTVGSKKGL